MYSDIGLVDPEFCSAHADTQYMIHDTQYGWMQIIGRPRLGSGRQQCLIVSISHDMNTMGYAQMMYSVMHRGYTFKGCSINKLLSTVRASIYSSEFQKFSKIDVLSNMGQLEQRHTLILTIH